MAVIDLFRYPRVALHRRHVLVLYLQVLQVVKCGYRRSDSEAAGETALALQQPDEVASGGTSTIVSFSAYIYLRSSDFVSTGVYYMAPILPFLSEGINHFEGPGFVYQLYTAFYRDLFKRIL